MTADSHTSAAPIFVGGTGRSGTTIMGKFLNSHASLVTPVNENKLIVEDGGLRSLVENLSLGDDYKGNHYAISRFIEWAATLRTYGFKNAAASYSYRGANKVSLLFLKKRISPARICRIFPFLRFSLIGIGERYGLHHYDACLESFLAEVIGERDEHGIFDTEGLIKPIYSPSTSDRKMLLRYARNFLHSLNEKKLQEADAQRWCDDTPLNARYADFLLELYPDAKIIHMVRDPRDVAASYLEKTWASRDLEMTLNRLKRHYRELVKVQNRLPVKSFRTFRLEDFVSDSGTQIGDLCHFLQVDADGFDGGVSFEPSSFGRYKKKFSGRTLELVERRLGEACAYYGYS